jgi:hypothetical protein
LRIGEEICLWCRLVLLLLETVEKQVEQAFGGRRAGRKGEGEHGGSNGHAAPHALIGQLDTQRLLHATLEHGPGHAMPDVTDSNAGW